MQAHNVFSIFDVTGILPLARGHTFENEEQLDRLVDREATEEMREVDDTTRKIAHVRPDQLPAC